MKDERSINADSSDQMSHDEQPVEEAQAKKKPFVEPEISVPVDVFKATTFFLFASTEADGEF